MYVQTREAPRVEATAGSRGEEPLLPLGIDEVVPDVGRVSDEKRLGVDLLKRQGSVVTEVHGGPVTQPTGSDVGSEHDCGERVDIGTVQLGSGESPGGSEQVSARSCPWVHDPLRVALIAGPADHGLDDRRRGVGLPEVSAVLRRADGAVRVPEGVESGANEAADVPHIGW